MTYTKPAYEYSAAQKARQKRKDLEASLINALVSNLSSNAPQKRDIVKLRRGVHGEKVELRAYHRGYQVDVELRRDRDSQASVSAAVITKPGDGTYILTPIGMLGERIEALLNGTEAA